MTPQGRGSSGRTRSPAGAAARREKKEAKLTATVLGVKLELPAVLPATFSLDYGQIESAIRGGRSPYGSMYDLLISLIGAEQLAALREKMADHKTEDGGVALYFDAINTIALAYGTEPGES